MSRFIILAMCMPFLASCTNESERNHDLMIKRYFKAAAGINSSLHIRSIHTHSKKRTAYTSVIKYQYVRKDGQSVQSSVVIETVGTNQNYIVVNGDCISTEQLAYELNSKGENIPAIPAASGNRRGGLKSRYMKFAPEQTPFR